MIGSRSREKGKEGGRGEGRRKKTRSDDWHRDFYEGWSLAKNQGWRVKVRSRRIIITPEGLLHKLSYFKGRPHE
jgi:hypothetical protein